MNNNDSQNFKICLLGSIPKGDKIRENWRDWKSEYKNKLSQISNATFTDGDEWKDETKPLLVVGHDANLIKQADVIIVNAESKLGAGTSQEMVIAKYFSKPVISVLPKNTHHRRSGVVFDGVRVDDWIHPFILTFSDVVVESIDECVEWVKDFIHNPENKRIKDISVVDEAVAAYLKTTK